MSLPGTDLLTVTQVYDLMQLMESLQPELGARETQEETLSNLEDSRRSIGQKQTFIGLTKDHEEGYERADLAVKEAQEKFEELNKVLKAKKETVGWYDIMGALSYQQTEAFSKLYKEQSRAANGTEDNNEVTPTPSANHTKGSVDSKRS